MSSARGVLSVVGQAVGAYFGGPIGAAIGGVIGGEIGGLIDGPPEGPRLDDLSAPQVEYGGKIGRFYGGPKWFHASPLWMSEKREDSEVVGGKGGDSGVEQFSYRIDLLARLCESREGTPCEVIAVTGVEVDGQLVWTNLASATAQSRANSLNQEIWSDMEVLLGHEDQAPWSVMEASVGATNANAYRGYLTVGFSDFLLGQGGAPRSIRIQAITVGTQSPSDVVWLLQFNGSNGATSTTDSSSYGNTPTMTNAELQSSAAEFGSAGASSIGGTASTISSTVNHAWTENDDMTISGWASAAGDAASAGLWIGQAGPIQFGFVLQGGGGPERYFRINLFDQVFTSSAYAGGDDHPMAPFGSMAHYALIYNGATHTATLTKDGSPVLVAAYSGTPPTTTQITTLRCFDSINDPPSDGWFAEDGFKVTLGRMEWDAAGFTPPTTAPIDDGAGGWTPGTVDLRDILEYEATRCAPLAAANIDFSASEGFPVECHVAVGSAAEAIQPLLTRFWFDLYSADKLYLVRRGGAIEQTIPNRWTGSGVDGRSEAFSGLLRANDVEVAKKRAVTYSDVMKDGEADTRTGDREAAGTDVDTMSLNLNMRPSEAQGLADTATADARVAGHTASVRLGARHGLLVQPGSVISLLDHQGNSYRSLVRRLVWDRWVWNCDVRLDDPNILRSAGVAVDVDQRAITVVAPPDATLYVLDIPLLRTQDDGPGEYVAVTQTGRFRGVDIMKSNDDVTYTRVTEVAQRATAGACDSALPAFEGWGWDNSSVLTVTLDDGSGSTLSSATKPAIEASRSLNLAAVGAHGRWELIQFSTAMLVTGSTYELRGFLRNLFGTEAENANHTAADSFVLIQANGMARVPGSISDLGQTRYYKAVPAGRSAGNIAPVSIVCEEQALLPYAPVDVRNDAGTVRWNRRSRIDGAVGIDPPIGEASERYDAEQYSGATLEDSETITVSNWTPSVNPSGKTIRIYQLSEIAGRGHVAEKVVS